MKNSSHQIAGFIIWLLSICLSLPGLAVEKPELMLAKIFHPSADVAEYWISEKLDGVRARWDGQQLISRGGTILNAPAWFTKDFPTTPLDGELWIARGKYQKTVSIVRQQKPHNEWKQVRLMVFDLPEHSGDFSKRVAVMRKMADHGYSPHLIFLEQFKVKSKQQLMLKLHQVTDDGGEGLMLHHQDSLYRIGRSNDLLKLKPFADAEAEVIGYRPGQGQFEGKMGAIKVRVENGKEFYIGSGFNHKERENPPALGSIITFRYQGFTDSGIPRFAVFKRVRDEP